MVCRLASPCGRGLVSSTNIAWGRPTSTYQMRKAGCSNLAAVRSAWSIGNQVHTELALQSTTHNAGMVNLLEHRIIQCTKATIKGHWRSTTLFLDAIWMNEYHEWLINHITIMVTEFQIIRDISTLSIVNNRNGNKQIPVQPRWLVPNHGHH